MDELKALQSMGLSLPSPAYLVAAIVFGLIGVAAWRHGKKAARPAARWIGLALMLYPYLVSSTPLLVVIGVVLCAALALTIRRRPPD